MQILPLRTQEVNQEASVVSTKNAKGYAVLIPHNWWYTDSNFYFPVKTEANLGNKIKSEAKPFSLPGGWNISEGDYHVRFNIDNNGRDFLYYRDLKRQILKYSYLGAMLLVVGVVYFTSTILLKF